MKVKIYAKRNAIIPELQTEHSVAVDLHANFMDIERGDIFTTDCAYYSDNDGKVALDVLRIYSGGIARVPTGLYIAVPNGYEAVVRPRSGLALKFGITIANSPGTIDSDYRGEIMCILINHGSEYFDIKHGDRIAQLALRKSNTIEWERVSSRTRLGITKRDDKGFGSTGK